MNYKEYTVRVFNEYDLGFGSGDIVWYSGTNKKLFHREDGPAIEYAYGDKVWYINGKLHRLDGPAVELSDGKKYWYLDGVKFTEAEFNARKSKPSYDGKIVEIEGKKFKLIAE